MTPRQKCRYRTYSSGEKSALVRFLLTRSLSLYLSEICSGATGGGTEGRPACQPMVTLLNFTTHRADLLSVQACSSLLRWETKPDLASARQVGEIRDNRIKARAAALASVPAASAKVSG